jgi:hypothetical protein
VREWVEGIRPLPNTAGLNQREANIQTHTAEIQRLLDLLQVATIVLVGTRFNGLVTNGLQAWGYQVVAAPPHKGKGKRKRQVFLGGR